MQRINDRRTRLRSSEGYEELNYFLVLQFSFWWSYNFYYHDVARSSRESLENFENRSMMFSAWEKKEAEGTMTLPTLTKVSRRKDRSTVPSLLSIHFNFLAHSIFATQTYNYYFYLNMPVDTHIKRAHPILFGLLILFTLVGWAMCAAVTNHCKYLLLFHSLSQLLLRTRERKESNPFTEEDFPV